jgi:cytochrome P450
MSLATPHLAPGPPRRYPLANWLALQRNPLEFLEGLARDYGDVSRFRLGPVFVYLVNDPELIRSVLVTRSDAYHKGRALERAKRLLGEGLLTSEESVHLRQRRLMQPAFHRERISGYGETMVRYAEHAAERWKEGETIDVHREMVGLTLAIVGKTLFDADVEGEADEIGGALTEVMELFQRLLMVPFGELLEKLPLPSTRRFERARGRLDATIARLIEERRKNPRDRRDLLTLLILTQDTEGDGGGMSDAQLRDEAMTIFLAGHETTANALTWTWHLLSQNPDAEVRLHEELDRVLGARPPGVSDLPRLSYTEMVLSESMRLYPPAWVVGRRAIVDHELGGYRIPAGSILLLSQWITHRDARFFPDPLRFDPLRFTPEAVAARPKFAYFPFGGGPRVCIGEGFAWMEGVLLLAATAKRWRFVDAGGAPVRPAAMLTLRPRGGLPMRVELRRP